MVKWANILKNYIFGNSKKGKPKIMTQEMLKPSHFGLKYDKFSNIQINSLFEDNIFITKNIFETKFGTPINFLNYASLKQLMVKIIY